MSSMSSNTSETAKMKEIDPEKNSSQVFPDPEEEPHLPDGEPITRTPTTPAAPLTELDKGLIAWDSPRDPENPLYFPARKRITNFTLICIITFISPLGSTIFAPGIEYTLRDLNEPSRAVGSLMITIFLLGYALGPVVLAPLSEMYGRWIIITTSIWFFNAMMLGCGLVQNMPGLIIMRFLAGAGGSSVMALAPAIVADLYPIERRSFAMGIMLIVQSVCPAAGPIAGGFIAQRLSWRWTYYILVIGSSFFTLIITFCFAECYGPVVLDRKTKRLRKELNRSDLRSKLALPITKKELLKRSLIRPLKLLTRSPIVFANALYVATLYGMLYLSFTTVTQVFVDQYNFSVEIAGLTYTGLAIGMCTALGILMNIQDKLVATQRAQNGGVFEPEMRLKHLVYFAATAGPALIVYGWTAEKRVHWIVPIIALGCYGFGMVSIFMGTQTYAVDAFSQYAASAVSAIMLLRSLVGTFLPFAGPPIFQALGVGWGNTVLGLIGIAFTPSIPLFRRYGKAIRQRFPVDL